MPYCSVCDRELRDDERECPFCGAPSTTVMDALEHGDDEWESLADRGTPALLRDGEERDDRPPGGSARGGGRGDNADRGDRVRHGAPGDDPEWDALVARLDEPEDGHYVKERVAGRWRRFRARWRRAP